MPTADCGLVATDLQFAPGAKPTGTDCCEWPGVECCGGRIVELKLANGTLTGSIPASLGSLDALEGLDLRKNSLHGSVPRSIANLVGLKRLDLSANDLSGELPVLPLSIVNCTLLAGNTERNSFACTPATNRSGPCFADHNSPLQSLPTACPAPLPLSTTDPPAATSNFPLIPVAAGAAALLILAIAAYLFYRRRQRSRRELDDEKPYYPTWRMSDNASFRTRTRTSSVGQDTTSSWIYPGRSRSSIRSVASSAVTDDGIRTYLDWSRPVAGSGDGLPLVRRREPPPVER
ncbi:hypothetical protein H9P43_009138 [Blastocladiella emersonii ATCC 22665]|nr:hypothetical protein H9P43_009138 [Blastocladiella emersonii ATCC 22665]